MSKNPLTRFAHLSRTRPRLGQFIGALVFLVAAPAASYFTEEKGLLFALLAWLAIGPFIFASYHAVAAALSRRGQ